MSRRLLVLILIAGVAAAGLALVDRAAAVDWLLLVVAYVRDAGLLGVGVFALAYIASAVLFLPGAPLTIGAGFAYGLGLGTLIVSPVSLAAAVAAFLIGRFVARDWVGRRMASDPRFAAIDAAVAAHGFKVVALLRLSPLFPFSLLNYALGLTRVSLRDYVLGSWLGMLPATVLFVYLGSLVTSVGELGTAGAADGASARRVLYWAGLGATLLVTVAATRLARRALAAELTPASDVEEPR